MNILSPHGETLTKLVNLIRRLHGETQDFVDNPQDEQAWYNRGYANGMVYALDELGFASDLDSSIVRDPPDVITGFETFSWGRAYQHGFEMGAAETRQVVAPAAGYQ
jgi:hypothetical protein